MSVEYSLFRDAAGPPPSGDFPRRYASSVAARVDVAERNVAERNVAERPAPPVESHVDADDATGDAPVPMWRRLLSSLFTIAILAAVAYLWPAPLGGDTRLVIVAGNSMEPTYDLGDMVVTRDGGTPSVGDPVVFSVPEGAGEGVLVIHRIIDVDDDGFFITQGDNRSSPDQWLLSRGDIVGEPLLHVPKAGHVVYFLQRRDVIAILVGLLVVFLLWPKSRDDVEEDAGRDADTTTGPAEPPSAVAEPLLVESATVSADSIEREDTNALLRPDLWSDAEIDHATMAEATAWLDEQLGGILHAESRSVTS